MRILRSARILAHACIGAGICADGVVPFTLFFSVRLVEPGIFESSAVDPDSGVCAGILGDFGGGAGASYFGRLPLGAFSLHAVEKFGRYPNGGFGRRLACVLFYRDGEYAFIFIS